MDTVILFLAFSILSTMTSYASEIKEFSFSDETKTYSVKTIWDNSSRIAVSSDCNISNKNSCLALKQLVRASVKKVHGKYLESSANPGALICEDLGGRVIIGRDLSGNENSFCKFKDKSLVDCGTLSWFGREK